MRIAKAIAVVSALLSQSIASGLKQTPGSANSNLRQRHQTNDEDVNSSSISISSSHEPGAPFERNLQGCVSEENGSCKGSLRCCDGLTCTGSGSSKLCVSVSNGTDPPTMSPSKKPTSSPTKEPTNSPTNPQTPSPTNSPTTHPPTSSPLTPKPTRAPAPVTCLCCFHSPGFGDYFSVEQGGYYSTDGSGMYGDGELSCTAAFLNAGSTTTTLDLPLDICQVNMLVIGGGGGGGGSSGSAAGGGGAGEFVQWGNGSETLVKGSYSVTVGSGGAGGTGGYVVPGTAGSNGGITSISSNTLNIQANGGGGGGGPDAPAGKNGGSGGGAYLSNAAGQSVLLNNDGLGNGGGLSNAAGGGGGGATGKGQDFSGPLADCYGDYAGDGGPGVDKSAEFGLEFGDYGRFAGGGGGGASGDYTCPTRKRGFATDGGGNGGEIIGLTGGSDGKPNSGGGGGAASGGGSFGWGYAGGDGGSGIVLIRFKECSSNVF